MPGGTAKYGLPYLLNTEGLWTIGNVTKLLAERLEALIDSGVLKGGKGDPGAPGGPNGPAASIRCDAPYIADSGSLYFAFNGSTVDYDLRTAGGAQTTGNGFKVSRTGIYQLYAVVPWATNNAAGQRVLKIVDADGNALAEDVRPGSAIEQISQLSVVLPLAAGATISAYLYQNSGAKLTYGGNNSQGKIQTRFSMTWLGPSS